MSPALRVIAPLLLVAAGCHGERLEKLDWHLGEVASEAAQASSKVAALEKRLAASEGTIVEIRGVADAARLELAEQSRKSTALVDALLEHLGGAAVGGEPATFAAVWRAKVSDAQRKVARPTDTLDEVLQLNADGMSCGYRAAAAPGAPREAFRGRWERHGKLLIEHRTYAWGVSQVLVRELAKKDDASLALRGVAFEKVAEADYEKVAATSADKAERLAGLSDDCLKTAAQLAAAPKLDVDLEVPVVAAPVAAVPAAVVAAPVPAAAPIAAATAGAPAATAVVPAVAEKPAEAKPAMAPPAAP